ncbi:hypothetical protein Dda_8740 [Drechslerella dactyloides]|uniref:Uncharacterized protein n=1 Tax=Drechslerella dactyloides TaxID=74499 RepID=A0AAD6NFX0_DREDA|nr:hypothetical protein Dda_8740 [Drechslerella dactyloides]
MTSHAPRPAVASTLLELTIAIYTITATMPRCNKLPTAEIQASVGTLCLAAMNRYKDAKAAGVLGPADLDRLYSEFLALSSEMSMLALQQVPRPRPTDPSTPPSAQLWLV